MSCGDSNALTCSRININYALTCKDGYTGGHFSSSAVTTGGTCQACASFCKTCQFTGPGNCDSTGCIKGTVQITGTSNCTKCFQGCVTCSASDPNSCTSCGNRRYLTTSSTCESCPTGCKTCTSATLCQSCLKGYFYSSTNNSCTTLPAFCVSISTAGVCDKCFAGYALNTGTNTCVADTSCNATSSCTICPQGYTLASGVCSVCTLGSNCLACSSTSSSTCIKCNTGYYLDSANACQTCTANCAACDSSTFCTTAATGYYVVLSPSDSYTGVVAQCYSTCATCVDQSEFCLSCIAGYTLVGTTCRQNFYLVISLILGPGATNSIFGSGDATNLQASKTIRNIGRFGQHFFGIIPSSFKRAASSEPWDNTCQLNSMKAGSVAVNMNVGAGTNTNSVSAQNSMSNAIASSSGDGYTVLSSSVSSVGGSTSSDSGANLGLILGLSIPLSILLILIILILVKTRCSDDDDYGTPGDKDKENFYSEDRIGAEDRT